MSKNALNVDRISDRISSLLPDFVQDEAPVFEQFLKAYYEFLEAEVLTLESLGDSDPFQLEDGQGNILAETATSGASPDAETSKLLNEKYDTQNLTIDPFKVGDYIVGKKTKTVAKINIINGTTFYTETIHGTGFDKGETVETRQGNNEAKVKSFKQNTVLANNQLLDYSDIDNTTEEFLDYFQKDFIPSLDLDDTKDARLTIKNISDLYQKKGTKESVEFLLRLLYGQDAEIRYLIDETIQISESGHNHQRRIAVVMDDLNTIPSATDKVVQYGADGISILAESIVENVYIINTERAEYSIEVTDNHFGTFEDEYPCTFVDRDGVTKVTGRAKGILSGLDNTRSSIYVAQEDGDTLLLESPQLSGNITTASGGKSLIGASSKFLSELKVGDTIKYKVSTTTYTSEIATITDDVTATLVANASATAENVDYFNDSLAGGLLNEHQSFGSMYSLNDPLIFTDGKAGRDVVKAKGVIDGLRRGGVEKVYIEDGGTGYNGGDIIVFDNSNADGNAAEAVIGAIEDVVIAENRTEWGQFQITATAGQTLFNGTDDNGQLILFNDNSVTVFVDGVEKTPYTDYTFKNDRVTFTSGQSAGAVIEIYTDFNNILLEDGDRIQLHTTESHIRSVTVTSTGTGYTTLPQCFPGGYIYLDPADLSGYQVNEVVTGGTSNATATVVRIETDKDRLVVKRLHTDTGQFTSAGELITGGTSGTAKTAKQIKVSSGTGAKLIPFSTEIGGVGSLNIQEQGYNFRENQVMDSTSHYKMLITSPSGSLTSNLTFTGKITGATGKVVSYNANQHVLTFTDLDGHFLDNEVVGFNNNDTFKCLSFNPFQARGQLGAEGIIQRQLVTNNSTLDESASNIHDGLFYQTHSYIIKVGESINKYRAIVKDLVHPSGHIFFGEVAVKETVNPFDEVLVEDPLTGELTLPRNTMGVEVAQDGSALNRFTFVPTIVIKGVPTHHIDLENATRDNYLTLDVRDDESNMVLEDGSHVLLESSPDVNAITEYLKEVLIYPHYDDPSVIEPLMTYMPTDLTAYDANLEHQQGHVNLILIKSKAEAKVNTPMRNEIHSRHISHDVSVENNGVRNVYVINGVRQKTLQLQTGHTYYFGHSASHPFKFSTTDNGSHASGVEYSTGVSYLNQCTVIEVTGSTPTTLYYYCDNHTLMGGAINITSGDNRATSLSIDNVNNPSHSPYERRAELYRQADSGIVIPSYHPFDEEAIVFEDGFKIIIDNETHFIREEYEPIYENSFFMNEAGSGMGARFVTEDGDTLSLEDGSYVAQNTEYLGTERVQNNANFQILAEDGDRLTLEDGGSIVDERTQGNTLSSYVPFGNKIGDLNKIVNQNTYDIAYYLLDESIANDSDEDRIVLEDGHGSLLLESSKNRTLSFEDMDAFLPNFRIKDFDEKFNKRTNITWNAVIKSSNITNSTLSSL